MNALASSPSPAPGVIPVTGAAWPVLVWFGVVILVIVLAYGTRKK